MEHELITATWIIAFSTIGAVTISAIYYTKLNSNAKKQNEISKKQIEYLALLEIMKIFSDPQNANSRHKIYSAYRNNALYGENGELQGQDQAVYVASIVGTYNQMGKLVKEGFVQKDQFLDMYYGSVIRMYKVLKKHLKLEEKKRNSEHYAIHFRWIFDEAIKYLNDNFPEQKEPEPF